MVFLEVGCMIYWFTQTRDMRHIRLMKPEGERIINETSFGFLSNWCLLHGSTLEGRKKAACHNLSVHQKVPILISARTKDIVFPTRAMHHEACYWINYRTISEMIRKEKETELIFLNGTVLRLSVEYRSVKRSMQLCQTYLEHLTSLR